MNRHRTLALHVTLAFVALALAVPAAFAQQPPKMYRWIGPDGKPHYSDVLPPEALTEAHQEMSKSNGITLKDVDRAATPEERAATKAKAEADAKAAEALEKAKQSDQMLLASYPSEQELDRAYRERLSTVAENLKTTRMSLDAQEQSMDALLGAAAKLELENKPVPLQLATSIRATHTTILEQQQAESQEVAQSAGLKQEASRTLAHYRELKNAAASAASAPGPGIAPAPPAASGK